ncbi:MAG: hypothetical protein ABI574_07125 [Burkholderiales bacterium]
MAYNPDAPTTTGETPFPRAQARPTGNGASPGEAQNHELMNRVVQSAHQTIDRLAEKAGPHVERIQQGVTGANEKLHQQADQLGKLSSEWTESLRCTVRERPLAAVGTAVVLGLLIARLTR